MPFVETRLISPTTLTTSAASALYTVPTGYSAIIKQLVVTNITGTTATFTFYIGAASAGNALFSGTSVAANDTVIINLSQVLSTGEVLRALASTGSALNLTVSGVINDGPLASTATYIPDNAITSAKIAAGAVDTTDIANNAVTQGKLATTLSGTTITTNALRSTAIPSPFAGQTCYETDTNRMYVWNGTAWVIPNKTTQNPDGLELIKTQTIGTGVTSVPVSDVFSATYDNYLVKINRVTFDYVSTQDGRVKLGNVSGSYRSQLIYSGFTSSVLGAAATSLPTFYWVGVGGPSAETDITFELMNPFLAKPTYLTNCHYLNLGNGGSTWGVEESNTSHTAFTFFAATGTITGGTISVYGYRK